MKAILEVGSFVLMSVCIWVEKTITRTMHEREAWSVFTGARGFRYDTYLAEHN